MEQPAEAINKPLIASADCSFFILNFLVHKEFYMRLDHFQRVDGMVVEPAFLVRGVDSTDIVRRLQQRMAQEDIEIPMPHTVNALNKLARVGLALDQQDALVDALAGEYAQKVWGDKLEALRTVYPANLVDALCGKLELEAQEVHTGAQAALDDVMPTDEDRLAFEFLYRAWQIRQRVVIEGRPMSLIPVIGGDTQGDTPFFTPVLQRQNGSGWRLGQTGDDMPVSPLMIEETDVRVAVRKTQTIYSEWYHKAQERLLGQVQKQAGDADLSYAGVMVPVWGYLLRTRSLSFGDGKVVLENINHNRLFRFRYRREDSEVYRHLIFEMTPGNAITLAIKTAGAVLPDEFPTTAEVEEAWLDMMGGRGGKAQINEVGFEVAHAKPLDAEGLVSYLIEVGGEQIVVAWVQHPNAIAVASGATFKTRGVVMAKWGRLGVFPVTPKTKKPDLKDMWQGSKTPGLDPRNDPAAQRALSAWLAWLWQQKAGLKKYQN